MCEIKKDESQSSDNESGRVGKRPVDNEEESLSKVAKIEDKPNLFVIRTSPFWDKFTRLQKEKFELLFLKANSRYKKAQKKL